LAVPTKRFGGAYEVVPTDRGADTVEHMTDTTQAPARGRVRVEPGAKRVRALLAGQTVVDTLHPSLVWEIPYYPTYYFPAEDVRTDLLVATGETKRSPSRGDGQLYDIKAEVEGRETISVRGTKYDVVRISTKAVRSGATRDPYQLKFYVTNDARRLVVMMTAEPSWGQVRMELTSATGTKQAKKG